MEKHYKIDSGMGGVFIVKVVNKIGNYHSEIQPVEGRNAPEWCRNTWTCKNTDLISI